MTSIFLLSMVIFLSFLLFGLLLRWFSLRWLKKWTQKTKNILDDSIIRSIQWPSYLWVFLLSAILSLRTTNFSFQGITLLNKVFVVFFILSVTVAISNLIRILIRSYGVKFEDRLPISTLTQNISSILVFLIGVLIVLQTLDISIAPILTALGVGGIAVALALQDTLSNLFSGIYILLSKNVRVGDYIKLDTVEEGYIIDISSRATKVRTLPNNLVIIPNQKLSQAIITNFHMPEKRMSLLIPISVNYRSDPDRVEQILIEEAKKGGQEIKGLLREPEPFVRLIPGFGESSLDFTLICQVQEFVDQYVVQHELRKRILKRFKQEGIQIPYPHRVVSIKEGV